MTYMVKKNQLVKSSICFRLTSFNFLKWLGVKPVTFLNWLLRCATLL